MDCRTVIRWLGPVVLAMSLFENGVWAGESAKIGDLLAHPESYNMKAVTVTGVVRGHRMSHFIGSVSKMEKCYQHFMIADESGAVRADYPTICAVGSQETVILQDGDRVTVEGNFSGAPGAQGLIVVNSVTKN